MARMKNRLKELRARHDLTQQELAEKVGVRRETITHLEGGNYNPSLELALKIAAVMETEVERIFFLENEDENSD